MLDYSGSAKKAKSTFFAYRNDIDIFTEDKKEDSEFYKAIFRRLVGNQLKINDIFPLGSKLEVIKAHEENKVAGDSGRKRIFIVDGDLDLILNQNPVNEKTFFVLEAYCIENFLIEENGCVKLTYYNHGSESLESCSAKFDFTTWLNEVSDPLIKLFNHLALLKEAGGSPEIRHATHFLKGGKTEIKLDSDKVNSYIEEIQAKIIDLLSPHYSDPKKEFEDRLEKIVSRWPSNSDTLLTIVSGKGYLLPLVQFRLNVVVDKISLLPKKNIKLFLADNCDLSRLENLKTALLN